MNMFNIVLIIELHSSGLFPIHVIPVFPRTPEHSKDQKATCIAF